MPIPGISDIRIGSDAITRVLVGTEEIWSSGEPPANDPVSIWYPNTPTGVVSTDEGAIPYTLGQLFNVTTPGVITHLCFVREGLPQIGRKMYLWDIWTSTLLAEANSPENAGWNTCPLSEPVHIDTSPFRVRRCLR